MGLYDVRCALSGMSTFGQELRLVWVHRGKPVGFVLLGHSDRGGGIDGMIAGPHHEDLRVEMKAWHTAGRWDLAPMVIVRKHRPYAAAFEAKSAAIAAWQVGGGDPIRLDGEPVDMLPVIARVADAAAAHVDLDSPGCLSEATNEEEGLIARGVLAIYGALGGRFPFEPLVEQFDGRDESVDRMRRDAVARLERWPDLVAAVETIRYDA